MAGVFADETGEESRRNGFEGRDGCCENTDVGFDHGPVHCVADHVGRVGGVKHRRDIGDSNNGGDTGTVVFN